MYGLLNIVIQISSNFNVLPTIVDLNDLPRTSKLLNKF